MADQIRNNPTFRDISNRLDKAMGWGGYDNPKQSPVRAAIHGVYHQIQYNRTGNPREMERAKDQFCIARGETTCNNLQAYDAKTGYVGK